MNHCLKWYQRFDLTFTGFLINGAAGTMPAEAEDMYKSFSPYDGTEQTGYSPGGQGVHLQSSLPFFQESDIPSSVDDAAQIILADYIPGALQFHVYRSISQSPSYRVDVINKVQTQTSVVVVVDPLVLSILASLSL